MKKSFIFRAGWLPVIFWLALFTTGAFAGTPAQMTSPAIGSVFTSTSGAFVWNAGSGVTEYWLTVGSTPNARDVYTAGQGTNLTQTVTLPDDGRTLFVDIWSRINGTWQSNSYIYTALDDKARMTSPAGASTLTSASGTFNWSPGTGVSELWMTAGSNPGTNDLFGGRVTGTSQTLTLPTDGRRIFVRLWSLLHEGWRFNAYTYNAFKGADPKAELTSPLNGSTLTSGTVNFEWNLGAGVDEVWLTLGLEPGTGDLLSMQETGTFRTVEVVPDGNPLYADLWSQINGVWGVNHYL